MRKMSKLSSNFVVGLAALALFTATADAGQKIYTKRVGFFESLFGAPQPRAPSRPIFSSDGSEKLTWWEQKEIDKQKRIYVQKPPKVYVQKPLKNDIGIQVFFDEPLISKKQQQKQIQADRSEPDPLPGLGLGIVNYMPPVVVPVYDAALLKIEAQSQEAELIRIELINKATNIRTVDTERKAILAFYGANSFKPIWTQGGYITPRAKSVLKVMSEAAVDGLVADNYLPVGLNSFDNVDEVLASDPVKVARFDIAMTVAAVKYARHLSGGQFDPNRLSLYNDIKPQPVAADGVMKVVGYSPFPEAYFASLVPVHPQYAIFKKALAEITDGGKKLDVIAAGPDVKVGAADERIPAIRTRLQGLGIAVADLDSKADPKVLDKKLSKSLRSLQAQNKIKLTGIVDVATLNALNADHSADERQRLVFNMERLRWLPKNLGPRFVFVNQPAYEVYVFDHNKVAWQSKVIIGKPMNQTYSFYDQIETVVFNPSWGVPASIIINEYGPKSRKDPSYLDRNGFKITNANGDVVSSRDVDWWGLDQAPTFGVQQPPGSDNALGELKFLFPNSHDIYMHDTPTKNLFEESNRAFSHGCVRVQNPREFASILLNMSAQEVEQNLRQKSMKGKKIDATEAFVDSHSINLDQKMPVYLTYFTAWTGADGKIQYYNDVYGRDIAMAKAFAFDQKAKNTNDSGDIATAGAISGGLTQN